MPAVFEPPLQELDSALFTNVDPAICTFNTPVVEKYKAPPPLPLPANATPACTAQAEFRGHVTPLERLSARLLLNKELTSWMFVMSAFEYMFTHPPPFADPPEERIADCDASGVPILDNVLFKQVELTNVRDDVVTPTRDASNAPPLKKK